MRILVLLALSCLFTSCSNWQSLNAEFEGLGKNHGNSATTRSANSRPPSIPKAQKELQIYYSSNQYNNEIEKIANAASKYITQEAQFSISKHIAITLDIDETTLSNRAWIEKNLLSSPFEKGVGKQSLIDWQKEGKSTAISPLHSIYQLAQDKGIEIFFISERPESMREITELNLIKQGFAQAHKLILKPSQDENISNEQFKSNVRRKLTQEGFKIITNIGDQVSDLEGGYTERNYKLPNPFYIQP